MADIFISYAREDRSRVELLAKALEDKGWSVFWDFTIPVGKTWRQVITEALDAAKCVVVVWTSTSINSDWVNEEAEEAQARRILVPAMIDKVKAPLGFRRMQAANLINWKGEPKNTEFEKLLKSIESILGDLPEPATHQKEITNSIGMRFVLIPAGSFTMGSHISPEEVARRYGGKPENYIDEQPPHHVEITKPFYLQTTEVTQWQWEWVMRNNPVSSNSGFRGDDLPAIGVSWFDAQELIRRLNRLEALNKHRLPTEAEWEYACRANTTTPFFTGECISTDQANYNGEYPGIICPKGTYRNCTVKVASFQPNSWGLYDMHGNVMEWCQDWYGDYPSDSVADPKGPEKGDYRVLRGGSWYFGVMMLRSASRYRGIYKGIPRRGSDDIGFRVARDL